jgi:hypothetical protein
LHLSPSIFRLSGGGKLFRLSVFGLLVLTFFTVNLLNVPSLEAGKIEVTPLPGKIPKAQKPGVEPPRFNGALDIRIHPQEGKLTPPAELLVTNPEGRKLGKDPFRDKTYGEMPRAYYEREGLDDAESGAPGPQSAIIYIGAPPPGQYRLQVFGIETANYTLEVTAYDREMNPSKAILVNIAVRRGRVNHYVIDYSNELGAKIKVRRGATRSRTPFPTLRP